MAHVIAGFVPFTLFALILSALGVLGGVVAKLQVRQDSR